MKNDDVIIQNDTNSNDTSDHNDVVQDDIDVSEEYANDTIKTLKEKLKKVEAERREYLEGWQRAKADALNARKRDEESRKEFTRYATESLITELLPTLESFDMAMSNKEAWEKIDKNWRMGVEHIAQQLKTALADHGLVEVNPVGLPFDVNRDEAVSYEPVDDSSQKDKVIFVVQKGYSLNGKIIRAPKVKVGEMK